CREVWRAGGHVISGYQPDEEERGGGSRLVFETAGEQQIEHFPSHWARGLVDEMDHQVSVIAEADPHALEGVDPGKIMRRGEAMRTLLDWRGEKENEGRFSWTLGLYGTEAMAAEAGLSVEEYWEQIIHACFLDDPDPVARWRETLDRIHVYRDWLNSLPIDRLHLEAEGTDLWMTLGDHRRWVGGSGRNIPSFEIFTS